MVVEPCRRLYTHPFVRNALNTAGLNLPIRTLHSRFQEWCADETNYSVGDSTAIYSGPTLIGDTASEERVIQDILQRLRPTDVFWDVGADKGLYTCLVGDHLNPAQIVAFEPHPVRRQALTRNLARNGIDVVVRDEALSAETTTSQFGYKILSKSTGDFEAQLRPGDRLIADFDVQEPTVVKIDVEGFELQVLRGLSKTLSSDTCRLVYCELHNSIREHGGTKEEAIGLLADLGFEVEQIPVKERTDQSFIRCVK